MIDKCMTIFSVKNDGEEMRPSHKGHWTDMLIGNYKSMNGIYQIHTPNKGIGIAITPDFWKTDEVAFEHIMKFVKDNNLQYEIYENKCFACKTHPACLYMNEDGHEAL